MSVRMAFVGVMVSGCADGTLVGLWTGSCDLTDPSNEHYELEYQLSDLGGGTVAGQATVEPDWLVGSILGFVDGTLVDDRAMLHAALGDLAMNFVLDLDGTLKRNTIEGSCASETSTGTGLLEWAGDLVE